MCRSARRLIRGEPRFGRRCTFLRTRRLGRYDAGSVLPDDEVHLFYLPTAVLDADAALRARFVSWLDAGERERHARITAERARSLYLATRGLVRSVLSRFAPEVPPDAWVFEANRWGKPFVAGPEGAPRLELNLSNTHGLVVGAFARTREVGVDVEPSAREPAALALAERFFSAKEAAALRALPATAQRERFLAYWTLKESYIKARGMGLAIPLGRFSFELDAEGGEVSIALDPELGDDPATWRFERLAIGAEHVAALAVRVRPGERVAVVVRPAFG